MMVDGPYKSDLSIDEKVLTAIVRAAEIFKRYHSSIFRNYGLSFKILARDKCPAEKASILDRVQLRAEEYNFGFKNGAQVAVITLLEEFGLGSMQIIKGL